MARRIGRRLAQWRNWLVGSSWAVLYANWTWQSTVELSPTDCSTTWTELRERDWELDGGQEIIHIQVGLFGRGIRRDDAMWSGVDLLLAMGSYHARLRTQSVVVGSVVPPMSCRDLITRPLSGLGLGLMFCCFLVDDGRPKKATVYGLSKTGLVRVLLHLSSPEKNVSAGRFTWPYPDHIPHGFGKEEGSNQQLWAYLRCKQSSTAC